MPLPSVGAPAPDFSLPATAGQMVLLSSLRGKNVLLAFFPLAFTGTCTAELCAMSEDYDKFESGDTVVLPISVDSVPTLKVFKAKESIMVDLLSDFQREVSRLYGVLNEEKFNSNRAYILIDKNGVVRWTHQEANNSERRENSEILAELARLG